MKQIFHKIYKLTGKEFKWYEATVIMILLIGISVNLELYGMTKLKYISIIFVFLGLIGLCYNVWYESKIKEEKRKIKEEEMKIIQLKGGHKNGNN